MHSKVNRQLLQTLWAYFEQCPEPGVDPVPEWLQ